MDVNIPTAPQEIFQPVRVIFLGRDNTVGPIAALQGYLPQMLQDRVLLRAELDKQGCSRFTMGMNVHNKIEMDLLHEFSLRNWETYEYMKMVPICVREDDANLGTRPAGVCRCNTCKPPDHKMVLVVGPDGVLMSTMAAATAKLKDLHLPPGVTVMRSNLDVDRVEDFRLIWKKEKSKLGKK